ncbi:MAG TPA: electron transfer flavoprotein subunit alpha/FixB family protein [Thermoanaerobaculia bacterium]|jgi:electron transfer flavoprotein alpha subunit|nr:electron transfer flavoprotein subunit alpha/FixB family protein [Thermoanaerobaculia bacterium]
MAARKVWAVLQQRGGELNRQSRETVAAAQELASQVDAAVDVVVLGAGGRPLADRLAGEMAVERVLCGDHPALETYTPGAYVAALAPAIRQQAPSYVLFPHTYQSMEYFPRLAQQVDGAIVPAVAGFRLAEGTVLWTRPVLGGKLQADVRVKSASGSPVLASIQPGAIAADRLRAGSGAVEALPLDGLAGFVPDREILGIESAAKDEVDLSKAEIIVAAGRGVGGADKMGVIEELARALGAEIGASRPVIDNGWLARDRQIGSSGQTVAPKLYIAAGISGAIQHLVGMKGAACIVAINKDPNAPIFAVARYGIVGDLHEVLPALTAAVKEAKGS